ncbi:hypothetical protein M5J15_12100 [Serratia symbiotica]|uniref:hypothetical protein n=1 Tax=Serratia symbiotica TaxID=138074 RepID=UPI001D9DF0A2|nr:hypothetical protein [Serratia symbiotica]NIG87556.1 hypothetical protein [Serratia symbiotica]USS95265.1 hypothetical protein M5J15_12100 [Serratia symbiotica]
MYYSLFPLTETIKLAITRPFPFLGEMVEIDLMSFSATFSPFWNKSKDFPIALTDRNAVNFTIVFQINMINTVFYMENGQIYPRLFSF